MPRADWCRYAIGSAIGCGLSLQYGENTAFYLVFPLAESMAKAFCRLFLWNFKERLCHSMWLSYLHSTVEMQLFSPNFSLAESITEEFCWLFLCNFKEKSINHFLWHSLSELFQNHAHILCPPLASVSWDTGASPHPFRSFCWRRQVDGALGAHPIRRGRRRRHRRHRHHETPGTHPLRQARELPSRGRAGCGNGLCTGNYGRPGKASTNSMVISGSASTN